MEREGGRLEDKFLGCLLGSALGDAIGEMAFRVPEEERLRDFLQEQILLRYTDDTAMAIGLAESLLAKAGVDQEHLGRTFHRHYLAEPWRGYASGPPSVFYLVENYGMSYAEAARSLFGGQGSLGNGAAMRVAPLGLFLGMAPNLYDQAAQSAAVTHAHPLAQDGAAVQALAVALAVDLSPAAPLNRESFLERLLSFSRTADLQKKLQLVGALLAEGVSDERAAEALGRSVKMQESLPFALFSFLAHPNSYVDCLFAAILQGGDRDTLGAMAGAVSGAYLGVSAIPVAWQEKLENRELLAGLAQALAASRAAVKGGLS